MLWKWIDRLKTIYGPIRIRAKLIGLLAIVWSLSGCAKAIKLDFRLNHPIPGSILIYPIFRNDNEFAIIYPGSKSEKDQVYNRNDSALLEESLKLTMDHQIFERAIRVDSDKEAGVNEKVQTEFKLYTSMNQIIGIGGSGAGLVASLRFCLTNSRLEILQDEVVFTYVNGTDFDDLNRGMVHQIAMNIWNHMGGKPLRDETISREEYMSIDTFDEGILSLPTHTSQTTCIRFTTKGCEQYFTSSRTVNWKKIRELLPPSREISCDLLIRLQNVETTF